MSRRLAPLLVVLVVAGCGGSGKGGGTTTAQQAPPANNPVSVAQRYVDALGAGDYATDCTLISAKTRTQVTQGGKLGCVKAFGRVMSAVASAKAFFAGAKVSASRVKGNAATVIVTSQKGKKTTLTVVRENGAWKVST